MGVADGAYTPVSIATTLEASAPGRQGRNIGIQQTMLPLFGLGLSPLLAVWLLRLVGWHRMFVLFAPPGLLLAYACWRVVPPAPLVHRASNPLADWRAVVSRRSWGFWRLVRDRLRPRPWVRNTTPWRISP